MTLQARLSEGDPRLYNVNRDLAHNAKGLMDEVAGRLEDHKWPELQAVLKRAGVTDDDLGKACQAYCKFLVASVEQPKENMGDCMARCGWFDTSPPEARIALMAMLGSVVAGYQFAGMREATLGGVGPANDLQSLRWEGRRSSILMAMPRWRRKLYRLRLWFKGVWRALRGRA